MTEQKKKRKPAPKHDMRQLQYTPQYKSSYCRKCFARRQQTGFLVRWTDAQGNYLEKMPKCIPD